MKFQLLFSLFFAFLVNSINSQTYKLEYAQKLSGQFNFVEAYPVWEDLSNVFLKKQKGDWEYLRDTFLALENQNIKTCLVSPELQRENSKAELGKLKSILSKYSIKFDAVCTKFPDIWYDK